MEYNDFEVGIAKLDIGSEVQKIDWYIFILNHFPKVKSCQNIYLINLCENFTHQNMGLLCDFQAPVVLIFDPRSLRKLVHMKFWPKFNVPEYGSNECQQWFEQEALQRPYDNATDEAHDCEYKSILCD